MGVAQGAPVTAFPVRLRWAVVLTMLLAAIVVPFVLFEREMQTIAEATLASPNRVALFAGGVVLLAADVVLPVPSSIVNTALGATLGVGLGAMASTIGMSVGCLIGYALGRFGGRPILNRFVGDASLQRAETLSERFGVYGVVISRPIPVLAEASVFLAGVNRMPFGQFVVLSTLSNLGISLVYAFAGARAVSTPGFLFAFVAALALPGIAMLAARTLTRPGTWTSPEP